MLAPTPFFADRGCHVRIYEEAAALSAMGHSVEIVTYHLGRDMPGLRVTRIPQVPWYRRLSAGPSWHKPYLDVMLFFTALRAARRFRPHLIHAHLHEGAFIGLFLRRLLGVPLLFDCQGSLTGELEDHGFISKGSLLHRLFSWLERLINNGAQKIVTSSGASCRDLAERHGVPAHKVMPLIDAVDTARFAPVSARDIRGELGLAAGVPVACFLGVLNSYQGVDLLLDAALILKSRGVRVHLLVMGFPHERYREKARELGVSAMVTFTGRIDYGEAASYLSACDIAVSPKVSLTEANGKLFNYMACGLPSVVFETPINREILGDAALFAPHGDAAAFADAIARLAADPELRRSLGEAARLRAVEGHSWEARVRELERLYRDMLAEAR